MATADTAGSSRIEAQGLRPGPEPLGVFMQ
jgi:hypothetical protein